MWPKLNLLCGKLAIWMCGTTGNRYDCLYPKCQKIKVVYWTFTVDRLLVNYLLRVIPIHYLRSAVWYSLIIKVISPGPTCTQYYLLHNSTVENRIIISFTITGPMMTYHSVSYIDLIERLNLSSLNTWYCFSVFAYHKNGNFIQLCFIYWKTESTGFPCHTHAVRHNKLTWCAADGTCITIRMWEEGLSKYITFQDAQVAAKHVLN